MWRKMRCDFTWKLNSSLSTEEKIWNFDFLKTFAFLSEERCDFTWKLYSNFLYRWKKLENFLFSKKTTLFLCEEICDITWELDSKFL